MIPASELMKIGMTNKEASVYLALLELGCCDVPTLAQRSGVNRTTTYVILEALFEKGIISSFEREKKKYFVAENPQNLEKIVKDKEFEAQQIKSHFSELLPSLMGVFNLAQHKPIVRYYEGKEAIQNLRKHILYMKGREYCAVCPFDFTVKINKDDYELMKKMHKQLFANNIRQKVIYCCDKEYVQSCDKKQIMPWVEHFDVKYICRDTFPVKSEFVLFDDKMVIADIVNDQPIGVMIKEAKIVDSFRVFFALMWDKASNFEL